jgi:hypothetical protein
METDMTNRQIVDAIHEGLPIMPLTPEEEAAPDKKSAGNHFAKYVAKFQNLEHDPRFAVTPEELQLMETIVLRSHSIRKMINALRIHLSKPFKKMVFDVINPDIETNNPEYYALIEEHWKRYKVVLPGAEDELREIYAERPNQLPDCAFVQIILGGIQNVCYSDCASLLAIPELYQQKKGSVISATSTLPFLLDISSSEKTVFDDGITQLMKHKNAMPTRKKKKGQTNFFFPPFNTQYLQLNEQLELQLHPDIIEPTREQLRQLVEEDEIRITGDRGGCPGRPLFPMIHRRIMSVAPRAIFPHAEHILSLPLE